MAVEPLATDTRRLTAPAVGAGERYHSLDFLRGALMLLGLVLHAAVPFDDFTNAEFKPYPTSGALGSLVVTIHAFRMPLFFVLAGFFASLVFSRRGAGGFVVNRGLRVGLPFAVAWLVLAPIVAAGFLFSLASILLSRADAWTVVWDLYKQGEFFFRDDLMYLWFLYYLLLFYAAFVPLAFLVRRADGAVRTQVTAAVRRLLASPWRVPALAAPTIGLLYLIPFAILATPTSFVPDVRFLLFYGAFFGAGVALYGVRADLGVLSRGAWLHLAAAAGFLIVFNIAVERRFDGGGETWRAVASISSALMIWSLFFGLTGVLLRRLERPVAAVRYVADASYWAYLLHVPVLVWLGGLVILEPWAPEVKFGLLLLAASVGCFMTYELFVRWTFLGTVMQGRRYPSTLRAAVRARSRRQVIATDGRRLNVRAE